jgi:hypothetical protein
MFMDEKVTLVFHGFLNLTAKQKLQLVGSINDYFDSSDRDPIRAAADARFEEVRASGTVACPCCGTH